MACKLARESLSRLYLFRPFQYCALLSSDVLMASSEHLCLKCSGRNRLPCCGGEESSGYAAY